MVHYNIYLFTLSITEKVRQISTPILIYLGYLQLILKCGCYPKHLNYTIQLIIA